MTASAESAPVTSTLAYEVREVAGTADRDACFAVRREVFVEEQGVTAEEEYDTYDETAVHLLAVRADGVPLGTGRLLYGADALGKTGADASVGSLGRLAVARAARGLAAVDLHAQTHALGFYERLGYVVYGPEFPDAGIPHRAMRRTL
ncbi:GNAT family acetyltransferase yjcF [Streptomyces laurentii]|uniref:GNAT family acetyltransferase yjcF n=1 Tax=Streptomyces laurentii TaxID=39478 RepID=A0A160NVE5_STRLU|nr:GNAT family acetyltransferase yjcF [Streptomyces laurentii]